LNGLSEGAFTAPLSRNVTIGRPIAILFRSLHPGFRPSRPLPSGAFSQTSSGLASPPGFFRFMRIFSRFWSSAGWPSEPYSPLSGLVRYELHPALCLALTGRQSLFSFRRSPGFRSLALSLRAPHQSGIVFSVPPGDCRFCPLVIAPLPRESPPTHQVLRTSSLAN